LNETSVCEYFSYIMATSFSGGGSRSTRREPPTMGKQLVNLNKDVVYIYFVNSYIGNIYSILWSATRLPALAVVCYTATRPVVCYTAIRPV
jgi:hypothetical protein